MQDSTAYSLVILSVITKKSGDSFITVQEFLAKIISTVKALLTKNMMIHFFTKKITDIRDTYHFKETIGNIDLQEGYIMGTLDIVGMFPSVPVKKMLEVTPEY